MSLLSLYCVHPLLANLLLKSYTGTLCITAQLPINYGVVNGYPDLLLGNMSIKNISDFNNQETIAKLLWDIRVFFVFLLRLLFGSALETLRV